MDYADASTAITTALGDLGTNALLVFTGAIGVAGAVFLIRWGFKKVKGAMGGKV